MALYKYLVNTRNSQNGMATTCKSLPPSLLEWHPYIYIYTLVVANARTKAIGIGLLIQSSMLTQLSFRPSHLTLSLLNSINSGKIVGRSTHRRVEAHFLTFCIWCGCHCQFTRILA